MNCFETARLIQKNIVNEKVFSIRKNSETLTHKEESTIVKIQGKYRAFL